MPNDLFQLLTQIPFVLIFFLVAYQAAREPSRTNVDIVLFFGAIALSLMGGWVADLLLEERPSLVQSLTASLIMAMPYLLLRLVADFSAVPGWLLRLAEAGLALSVAALLVFSADRPAALVPLLALYFFGLQIYAAAKFVRQARTSRGVTRRRMQAASLGSAMLGLAILVAGVRAAVPAFEPAAEVVLRTFALAAGASYLVAFAPPRFLRRAWQEPELRAFLSRAATLPRLPDTPSIAQAFEEAAARSLGVPGASIALWDEDRGVLVSPTLADDPRAVPARPGEFIPGWAFQKQHAIFAADAAAADPQHAELYAAWEAHAVLAAPITAGDRRLGVLTVFAPRAPLFARDDLALVQLLADQAAVVLESRWLIEEAAAVRAREEATRLKDDFLSAAAHDLRTPLTSIIAQAQLIDRRAERRPEEPIDRKGIRSIMDEAERLRLLMNNLLDVAKGEQGELLAEPEAVDLVALVSAACERHQSGRHRCIVDAEAPVVAEVDPARISQLLDNLIANAVKYSPDGGEVRVRTWCEAEEARIAVTDQGIGVPAADLPHIFERFHRAANTDDRRFAGMGLGLYICRLIAELHGGRIWAESRLGEGSTFHVALPAAPGEAP